MGTNVRDYLEYRTLGLMALMMLVIVAPIVLAFVRDLRASRIERQAERDERAAMRKEHNAFVCEHATRLTDVMGQQAISMLKVREGLDRVCERLGNGNLKGN